MKNFALLAALVALPLTPVAAQDDEDGDHIGSFGGSYMCQDGEHGIHLDLWAESYDGDEAEVSGVLGIFPTLSGKDGPSGMVAGSFVVSGTINRSDSSISLEPVEWIQQPGNYGAANLEGTVAITDDGFLQITGKPVVEDAPGFCSDLIATQFIPVEFTEEPAEEAAE